MVTALALILDAALALRGVGVGARAAAGSRRMPQPLLGDEVALESAVSSRSDEHFQGGYERGVRRLR